jgi:protein phosphatase
VTAVSSAPRVIEIPELSLVVLVGASGSGKSSFARKHFKPTEIVSSDACRGMVADDESDQAATKPAFELLHAIAAKRLELGRLTVIDATSVRREDRIPLVKLARDHHVLPVAVVLDVPARVCQARNAGRADRQFGPHVVLQQARALRHDLKNMKREGFSRVFVLDSEAEVETTVVRRTKLWTDRRDDAGPFDIVGDVHGCGDELEALLARLGYARDPGGVFRHPAGRRIVFLGDLCDRGPRTVDVLRAAMDMVDAGVAHWVPGNHDVKLAKYLEGKKVKVSHGLEGSIREIESLVEPERKAFAARFLERMDALVSHLVLDGGKLVVAHAGMKEAYIGRASGVIREFALYGETTGETDAYGLPVRLDWAADYKGRARVVYGHTPTPEAEWLNGTVNIDQGCCFGGKLTALRWPEREVVSEPARRTYYEPAKPFLPADAPRAPDAPPLQWQHDEVLDLEDVTGKRVIATPLDRNITIRAEHAAAALEVLSRFAVDPRWLVYLPPTMSPCETSKLDGFLEHPAEALDYFKHHGVAEVVCEEKHMGSRAVLVLCRDEAAGLERFGRRALGACYTRTGRAFFRPEMERAVLERLVAALVRVGFWDEIASSWVVLDCEVMPWNLKAQELLRTQYAAVGAAADAVLPEAEAALAAATARGLALGERIDRVRAQRAAAERFREAYRRYCWNVASIDDVKIAPFHVLAAEGRTFFDRDHVWHMETLGRLAGADPLLRATPWRLVSTLDEAQCRAAIDWWMEMTEAGGEGFVVKPRSYVGRSSGRIVQPAVKCRGREYLRIIYGPDYLELQHLERLRRRGLAHKRGLALREFALGLEGLERFVRREPLRRVHECAFGVLALESEPVDPRL